MVTNGDTDSARAARAARRESFPRRGRKTTPLGGLRGGLAASLLALGLAACGAVAVSPTAQHAATATAPATMAVAAPTAAPTSQAGAAPGTAASPGGGGARPGQEAPAWWPRDLVPREVVTVDLRGGGYGLLFSRGERAYALDITEGDDGTTLTGRLAGMLHLTTDGAARVDRALPMKISPTVYASGDFGIAFTLPGGGCAECVYAVHLFIPAGTYTGPGTYRLDNADLRVTPGGVDGGTSEDYYQATDRCTIVVRDAFSGDLDCAGLRNPNLATKTISARITW